MAQLKDSIVAGNLRVTNTTFSDTVQVTKIKAPATAGGTTYDVGTTGQFIRSNGTSSYWGSLAATDIPSLNYVPNTNAGVNAAINLLGEGTSNPNLADYYIAQYAGGGTTTKTYHRRPLSALWNTFRGFITVETTGSGNVITAASIANDGSNRKITFTKGDVEDNHVKWGKSASSFINYTPLDTLFSPIYNANLFAALNGAGVTIETSTDSGATWTIVNVTALKKSAMFTFYSTYNFTSTDEGYMYNIDFPNKTTTARIRITIDTVNAEIGRVNIKKILITTGMSDYYTSEATVTIKGATNSDPTNFSKTFCENIELYESKNMISIKDGIDTYCSKDGGIGIYRKIQFLFERTSTNNSNVDIRFLSSYGTFVDSESARDDSTSRSFAQMMSLPATYDPLGSFRFGGTYLFRFNESYTYFGHGLFINPYYDIYFGKPSVDEYGYPTPESGSNSLKAPTSLNSYTWTLPSASGTLCIADDTGSATQPVYISGNKTKAVTQPASGAWFSAVPKISSYGVLEIGRYIDFHATAASTNDYDVRLDASSTSLITLSSASGTPALRISGTLPRLRFQQTTSGKECDNENCGITAFPGVDVYGFDMTIQSGDRMIIGGGEYPTSFYNLANKGYYDQWSLPESCYIGADNVVVVHTNMSTPAQRKSFVFTGGGNFAIPESGGLYFSTKVASDATAGVYHKLLHAAGTDSTASGFAARTWTLPDKSGDIATTNRGGTLYFESYGNTYWGKVLSVVINAASRTAWGMFIISQATGSQASSYKGAGILQISCATNSSKAVNTNNTRAMWLVAGGNIAKANFKLIAKNNTPATGSVTFELWIKNTAAYHVWSISPMVSTDSSNSFTLGDCFKYYDARDANATTTTPTGDFVHTSEFFTPVTS